MSCREYRGGLIEWARGTVLEPATRRALFVHLDTCAECARFLEAQQALTAAEESLAAGTIPPADEIGSHVMAEFDRVHRRRSVSNIRAAWWLAAAAGLAAAVYLAGLGGSRRAPVEPSPHVAVAVEAPPSPAPAAAAAAPRIVHAADNRTGAKRAIVKPADGADAEPFITFPFTVPLAPEERATVVRMQIPVTALLAAGFQLRVSDPGAVIQADVLVSQDGRARAIRPLSVSISN